MAKNSYEIGLIPGDGTGPELMEEGVKVLTAAAAAGGVNLTYTTYETSSALYQRTGVVCPPEEYDGLQQSDAIYKGPIGLPDVIYPDGTELNVDIVLRIGFDLYANIRPIKLVPGVRTVLRDKKPGDIDYVVVRENTEGLYCSWAGDVAKTKKAQASGIVLRDEMAVDNLIITRSGTERIVKYAFELARRKNGAPKDGKRRVTCVDKSNVLKSYAFFRKIYNEVAENYPDIERDYAYCDAMTQWMIRSPEWYDVVVSENMFGDILTDLASATVGSVGMGASANIGDSIAMFEPLHGSAPKYAGQRVVNPIGQIQSGKMMLEWLGVQHNDDRATRAAELLDKAVLAVLAEAKTLTYDIGGTAKTNEVGDAIVAKIDALASL